MLCMTPLFPFIPTIILYTPLFPFRVGDGTVVPIVFIGGVTFAETSALLFLSAELLQFAFHIILFFSLIYLMSMILLNDPIACLKLFILLILQESETVIIVDINSHILDIHQNILLRHYIRTSSNMDTARKTVKKIHSCHIHIHLYTRHKLITEYKRHKLVGDIP